MIGVQFALGLFLTFMIFATNDVVRTAAPVAIGAIQGHDAATGATGVAFTAAGLASVIGALGVARLLNRPGRMRPALALTIGVAAAAHVLLGLAGSVALFVIWFSVTSLARGAMMPATNTIIAASVSHERRGAAFGVASSAQALAFIIGPLGAALFAAISLKFGFIALGVMLAAGAALVLLILREPDLRDRAQPVAADQDHEERPGVGAPA